MFSFWFLEFDQPPRFPQHAGQELCSELPEHLTAVEQFRKKFCRKFIAECIRNCRVWRDDRTILKHGADRETLPRTHGHRMGIIAVCCIKRNELNSAALDNMKCLWRRLIRLEYYRALRVITEHDVGRQKLQRRVVHLAERRMLPQKPDDTFAEGCHRGS